MKDAGARAWMIIALTFCALGLVFASRSSVGVLIPTWEAELGWARALSATGSSIVLATMAITLPLAGNMFDRLGPRPIMAGGLAFVGTAMVVTSTATQEWQFLLVFGLIGGIDNELGSEGYPKELEVLVEGVEQIGAPGKKLKFLRRIPMDPMTNTPEWGLRSYQDEPDSRFWGGQNVYDVYTTSGATALDGTKYSDW